MKTPPANKPAVSSSAAKITTLILAAVLGVAPLTMSSEGTIYKAYLDPVGIPTICNGHTQGVKLGQVASKAQCDDYYKADMIDHMRLIVKSTPTLVENNNALQAAGDFTFNAGIGGWNKSPMNAAFQKREWVKGCNAFVGYYDSGTFSKPQPKYTCRPKPGVKGKWLCRLPGLVIRRTKEQKLCLTGSWK